uniref:SH3 domain-containing protein n=1 Tax=Neolamprologus brichardi TaxID=32507 RepID=A0A3Q4HJA1_NEOBR
MANNNQLAKALYDNTAECPDELAFRKGDILTVINPNVAGTSGWWMCSLYGRHGLAPANRLKLLPQMVTPAVHEVLRSTHGKTDDSVQNIYQTPSIPRTTSSPAYERMDMIYKVPSLCPNSCILSAVIGGVRNIWRNISRRSKKQQS